MKKISLVLLVSFLGLSFAHANRASKCKSESSTVGGTMFFRVFTNVHKDISFKYTNPVKRVDEKIQKSLDNSCDRKVSKSSKWAKAKSVCVSSCDSEVADFHRNTRLAKSLKIRKHIRECRAMCGYANSLQRNGKVGFVYANRKDFKRFLRDRR